jgi:hypothetical protein
MRIATDVGGVLKERKCNDSDPTIWIKGAREALHRLSKHNEMYIISHVRPENEEKLKDMLRHSFVPRYIPEKRWFFVYEREKKLEVMMKHNVKGLIDDREELVKMVNEAGLLGLQFRSPCFRNWKMVLAKLLPFSQQLEDEDDEDFKTLRCYVEEDGYGDWSDSRSKLVKVQKRRV